MFSPFSSHLVLHKAAVVGLAAALASTNVLQAQTGSIGGEVSDAETGEPLGSVRVTLAGTGFWTLSNASGHYSLTAVPVGNWEVMAEYIGYTVHRAPAFVEQGLLTEVNFQLRSSVVRIEDIEITPARDVLEIDTTRHRWPWRPMLLWIGVFLGLELSCRSGSKHAYRGPSGRKMLALGIALASVFVVIGSVDVVRAGSVPDAARFLTPRAFDYVWFWGLLVAALLGSSVEPSRRGVMAAVLGAALAGVGLRLWFELTVYLYSNPLFEGLGTFLTTLLGKTTFAALVGGVLGLWVGLHQILPRPLGIGNAPAGQRPRRSRLPKVIERRLTWPAYYMTIGACVSLAIAIVTAGAVLVGVAVPGYVGRVVVAFVLLPVTCLYLVIPAVRMTFRRYPSPIRRERPKPRLGLGLFFSTILLVFLVAAAFLTFVFVWGQQIPYLLRVPNLGLAAFFAYFMLLGAFLGFLYLRPQGLLAGRFVLFLRTFSTTSDRAMLSVILRALPHRTRAVLLTAPRSKVSDLDPTIIGFAGLRLRHAISQLPVFLSAGDIQWEAQVRSLLGKAAAVVADVSEITPAVNIELRMIREEQQRRQLPVVLLKERQITDAGSVRQPRDPQEVLQGWPVIEYVTSWKASAIKILGLVVYFAVATWLPAVIVYLVFTWMDPASTASFPSTPSPQSSIGSTVFLLLYGLPLAWALVSPSIARESRNVISGAIQGAVKGAAVTS